MSFLTESLSLTYFPIENYISDNLLRTVLDFLIAKFICYDFSYTNLNCDDFSYGKISYRKVNHRLILL